MHGLADSRELAIWAVSKRYARAAYAGGYRLMVHIGALRDTVRCTDARGRVVDIERAPWRGWRWV